MNDRRPPFPDREDGSAPGVGPAFTSAAEPLRLGSSQLGDFEILREIGRGGMSIVYEAWQTSLRRKVALKRLPAAAVFDERWLERFQNEVRTAARLNHSNIVAFFAAGREDDCCYYAMQLIDGISLAEVIAGLRHCRESADLAARPCGSRASRPAHPALLGLCRRCGCPSAAPVGDAAASLPSTTSPPGGKDLSSGRSYHRAAAGMIVDAAQALDYAHEQGVLHLDVKPSNLLLDRDGKVWVTDFGASRSSSRDGSSAAGGRAGTVRYMSPEQMAGSGLIDRRSDVYSLGAALHELLTLERPASSPSTPPGRACSPRCVTVGVPPGLDAVVRRATADEPDQRYATAGALAEDLQRFLDGEPTHAPTPSRLTRWTAWSSQPRRSTGAIALLLLILLTALAGQLVSTGKQRGEGSLEHRAEVPQQQVTTWTAEERESLLDCAAMVTEIDRILTEDLRTRPPDPELVGDPIDLRDTLSYAVRAIQDYTTGDPAVYGDMRGRIARLYAQLGDYREAAAQYQTALHLLGSLGESAALAQLELTSALGGVLGELGQWDDAETLLRGCLETSQNLVGVAHPAVRDIVIRLHELAQLQDADDASQSELLEWLRQHVASRREQAAEDDHATLRAIAGLAAMCADAGSHEEAAAMLHEVVAGHQRLFGAASRETLAAESDLALLWLKQARLTEAEAALRANLDARRRALGDLHLDTIDSVNQLAVILACESQFDEAESLLRQASDGYAGLLGPDHPRRVDCLTNLAWVLTERNQLQEAEPLLRENWERVRRTRGEEHLRAIEAGLALSRLLGHQGDYDEAEKIGRQCLVAARHTLPATHTVRGEAAIQLALTLRAQDRADEAEVVEAADLAAIFAKNESAADCELLAAGFLDKSDLAEAVQWGRKALDAKRQILSQHAPISLAATLADVGRTLMAAEEPQEAEQLFRECLAIRREAMPEGHWLIAETEILLGDCLARQGLYAEAEPLLVQSSSITSPAGMFALLWSVDRLERVVDLYDRWNKPDETAHWAGQWEHELRALLNRQKLPLDLSPGSGKQSRPEVWLTCARAGWRNRLAPRFAETQGRLGACLVVLGRLEEGQPLLYESHATLSACWARRGASPAQHLRRMLRESVDRVVSLHQLRGELERAAAWRALLASELDGTRADQASQAVVSWEEACRLHPGESSGEFCLAVACHCLAKGLERSEPEAALSEYAKAEEILQHLLEVNPDHHAASQRLGQCYVDSARLQKRLGRMADCFADYERALQICPGESALWREAAWVMADVPDPALRNTERAISLARPVTERDATCPVAWRILGAVQYRAGLGAEAIESLAKAIRTSDGNGDPYVYLFLAMAHWQLGAPEQARESYDNALARMNVGASVAADLCNEVHFSQESVRDVRDVPADLMRYRDEAASLLGLPPPQAASNRPAPQPAR